MPTALITGITGQDGSYLTDLLLEKGYNVHGVLRRSSNIQRQRIDHLTVNASVHNESLFLHYSELSDVTQIRRILKKVEPDEVYHLAGQSHVGLSFDVPESTCDFTAMGTLKILEILRDLDKVPKFLNIGSSEIFGRPDRTPQTIHTPMQPVNPYGVSKAFAVQMTKVYREAHSFFACNAICYNHESPRRGESFVTRKITKSVAEISLGIRNTLELGDLSVERDWGYAPEYVEAMWRMMQAKTPNDYILATGKTSSLRDFLGHAFDYVNLDWANHVTTNSKYFRKTEPANLVGDPTATEDELGWRARTNLRELAHLMVEADILALQCSNRH